MDPTLERRRAARAARRRAVERRRRRALAVVGVLAGVAYVEVFALTLPAVWPHRPFPDAGGLVLVAVVSVAFGLAIRRRWALGLALAFVPLTAGRAGGFWGGLVGLAVAGPFAVAGLWTGMKLGLARSRRIAGRRRARAPRRPRAAAPA
jgi:hypothetical protein